MSARSPWRRMASPSNPGLVVVLILCAFTAGSFALGFAFQPSASGPAAIPSPPALYLTFPSGGPRNLSVDSFLRQVGQGRTELDVSAAGVFAPGQRDTRWTLGILGFTGHLCPGPARRSGLVPMQGARDGYEINGTSRVPALAGTPFLEARLCWDGGAPLVTSGSYVSAALPAIQAPGSQGTVARSLVLAGTALSSYSLAGGIAPTKVGVRSWTWTGTLDSSFQSQAPYEIPVIASSLPGIQHDNSDIFLSGIFFGIAGGAAVSVVPAWLDASDRRKARGEQKHEVKP